MFSPRILQEYGSSLVAVYDCCMCVHDCCCMCVHVQKIVVCVQDCCMCVHDCCMQNSWESLYFLLAKHLNFVHKWVLPSYRAP